MSERIVLIDEILQVTGLSRGRIDQLIRNDKFPAKIRQQTAKRTTPIITEDKLNVWMGLYAQDKQDLIDKIKKEKTEIEKRHLSFKLKHGL